MTHTHTPDTPPCDTYPKHVLCSNPVQTPAAPGDWAIQSTDRVVTEWPPPAGDYDDSRQPQCAGCGAVGIDLCCAVQAALPRLVPDGPPGLSRDYSADSSGSDICVIVAVAIDSLVRPPRSGPGRRSGRSELESVLENSGSDSLCVGETGNGD